VAGADTKNTSFPKTKTYYGHEKFIGVHLEKSHETKALMVGGKGLYTRFFPISLRHY
jgi:hypothetical protein